MPDFNTAVTEGSGADTAAPAAPAADTDLSIDALIAQAIKDSPEPATANLDSEQPSTATDPETATAETAAAPAANADQTSAETAAAEAPADVEGTSPATEPDPAEALDLKRARQLLAEANRREERARLAVQGAEAEFIRQLRNNPRAALQKHGLRIDELIDIDLATERPAETAPSKEAERISHLEKTLQGLQAAADQAKIDAAKANITAQVGADQRFAMINQSKSVDMVFDFMEAFYNEHGSPVPWNKAAAIVEKNLRDRFGAPVAKAPVAAPAKTQQKAAPAAVTASKQVTVPGQTLTNNSVRTSVPSNEEPTNPDELIAYLVKIEEAKQAAKLAQ